MFKSLSKNQKILFFIILTCMVSVIIYYIYSSLYSNNYNFSYENTFFIDNLIENTDNINVYKESDLNKNTIVVYICGAVKENKVITLEENSRICDAIDAVGGLTDEADLTNINLAYILEDGEKIYIPRKGEYIDVDSYISSYNNSSSNNKININKATQTELETIPGIGPSTSQKIIDFREKNGKFSNIEDIKNVSGIGEAKYEQIKNYICIK